MNRKVKGPGSPDRGIDPGFSGPPRIPSGKNPGFTSSRNRKEQIKKAIMRKPKYGGPQGGRPNTGGRVGKAKAASSGIKYLGR